jgi:hypothetical protein
MSSKRHNSLIDAPNYRGEEYDPDTNVWKVQIGSIVFETVVEIGSFGWQARTVESESWSVSRRPHGVIAMSNGSYAKRGNAENAMRRFIERLVL